MKVVIGLMSESRLKLGWALAALFISVGGSSFQAVVFSPDHLLWFLMRLKGYSPALTFVLAFLEIFAWMVAVVVCMMVFASRNPRRIAAAAICLFLPIFAWLPLLSAAFFVKGSEKIIEARFHKVAMLQRDAGSTFPVVATRSVIHFEAVQV